MRGTETTRFLEVNLTEKLKTYMEKNNKIYNKIFIIIRY